MNAENTSDDSEKLAQRRRDLHVTVKGEQTQHAADVLMAHAGLPKNRIKDAMAKGAVWIEGPQRRGRERLRHANDPVKAGDTLSLYYDPRLLELEPVPAECVADRGEYSVWAKPAGLLTQGSLYGDHCSLLRQVECSSSKRRTVFLVHRLDREAMGLVLIAHSKRAAAHLSQQLVGHDARKLYRVVVLGDVATTLAGKQTIDVALDGKPALTEVGACEYFAESNRSVVDLHLETGRKHQIRRHMAAVGHPVIGDPRYGRQNKDSRGLQLVAWAIEFLCPVDKKRRRYTMPDRLMPKLAVEKGG